MQENLRNVKDCEGYWNWIEITENSYSELGNMIFKDQWMSEKFFGENNLRTTQKNWSKPWSSPLKHGNLG